MQARPDPIPGSVLSGPFAVGVYARRLQGWLRERTRVQLFGEIWGFRASRVRVYFELRDAEGAMPCSMWRNDFDALGLGAGLPEGARVVVAGGLDFYPGSRTSSPSFGFSVSSLRLAGEGDLLAQLDALRKRLDAEGLFAPQKALARRTLPRSIGVVTGESGKARDDVLAGLARRGWAGRLVWAFAPVQDRQAAPRISAALQDLAACGGVDVIVVARGGGSLADLLCFCDETLCRTVALLGVPVIASVGHHTDRTLLDDVAAASCSTPTHAAETAVPCHCAQARDTLRTVAARLEHHGDRAVVARARTLQALSRAPAQHVARQRTALHQRRRELRAAARRRLAEESARGRAHARAFDLRASAATSTIERSETLARLELALAAHDPDRALARGFAVVSDRDDRLVTSAETARGAGAVRVRFADGAVDATIEAER